MSLDNNLITLLQGESTITDLVGTSPARIYSLRAPENVTRPFITIETQDEAGAPVLSGPTGTKYTDFRINCWDSTKLDALALADAVLAVLDGYDAAVSGTHIRGRFVSRGADQYHEPAGLINVQRVYSLGA